MQKLRWGLVGGGEGSQIGFTQRAASQLDGHFYFDAGALDIDTEKSKSFGRKLGLTDQKSYGSWEEMLEKEQQSRTYLKNLIKNSERYKQLDEEIAQKEKNQNGGMVTR